MNRAACVFPAGRVERLLVSAAEVPTPGGRFTGMALGCLGLGLLATSAGLWLAPRPTWAALAVNYLFWTGVAQGGVVLAATFIVAGARWGHVFQRMAAGLASFLPVALVLLPGAWFGRDLLFPPLDEAGHPWQQPGWLLLRDWAALAVMTLLSLAYLYFSVRPDLAAAHETAREGAPQGTLLVTWITHGWRGREEERRRCFRVRWYLAAGVLGFFVPEYSLLSIDLGLVVRHGFYSTLFPVLYLVGAFYSALAATTVLAAAWRRLAGFRELIAPAHLLDLGNLFWGFCLFLGYLWWSHYLIVWMANLPDEAAYQLLRWHTRPWSALSWAAVTLGFGIPFFLLFSRRLKQHALPLAGTGALAFVGVLLDRLQDLGPAFARAPGLVALLAVLGVTAAFLGAASLAYLWFMRQVPLFPVEDARFAEAIRLANVRC